MGEDSEVKKFYKDKNVFLTGATGFVGMAVVEKLLRTTEVEKIYMLIRPKKNKQANERLEEYIKNPVFTRLKEEKGTDIFTKLHAIGGDVGQDNLGISPSDMDILKEKIQVVIHSAATLDFEADLKETTNINLLGTRRVIQFCRELTNLQALLHVSSAYVNSHLTTAEEKFYPVHETADKVIDMASSVSDEDLEEVTKKLLGKYVNTYTFTKALAEQEVAASISHFPSCIVRPSMIVAAWKEPVAGWTSSKNGPQGFMMGAGKGVVRRLPADENLIADYIPVDIVVNGILVGAYHAATTKPSETPVFHLTSSTRKPFRWNIVTPYLDELLEKYPLKSAVWSPHLKLLPSLLLFKISAIFFHWIPAYILDTFLRITGGRPILVRLHTNIHKSLARLEPFIFSEWLFPSDSTLQLHEKLNDTDKEVFNLDIGTIDWLEFFDTLGSGVKQYLQNEPLSNYEVAKKKHQKLKFLNSMLQIIVILSIWGLVKFISGYSFYATSFVVPIVIVLLAVL